MAASAYEDVIALAGEIREKYSITTPSFGLKKIREIYADQEISLTNSKSKWKKVRAAYLIIDGESHVLVRASLPDEPRLFSLCHELKHHLKDRHLFASNQVFGCKEYANHRGVPEIEISAEVFAAELIFPEQEFIDWVRQTVAPALCTKEDVVALKRSSPAKMSYVSLIKRLVRLGFAAPGAFSGVQFQKLEDEIHGVPFYKTARFQEARRRKKERS